MAYRKIKENIGFIPGAVNVGVIHVGNGGVVLIDSGLEARVAKKILKSLEKENLFPLAVINTHSHADHCGGNAYLKQNTGLEIYASTKASPVIENPWLEPHYLFAGAEPISELKNKFLQAQPSEVDHTIELNRNKLNIDGITLGVIPLPGHAPGQIGVSYKGVLFTGDSYFSSKVLERHPLPFMMSAEKFLQTLRFLEKSDYDSYLSSHGRLQKDISEITAKNIQRTEDIIEFLSKKLQRKLETRDLVSRVCKHWGVEIESVQDYYLNRTVILACLSYLRGKNNLRLQSTSGGIFWQQPK